MVVMYLQLWWNQKIWLYVKYDLKGQGQLLPKTQGILTKVLSTSGPNLVIPSWKDELWCGQTQNWVKFEHEGQDWLPLKQ